MKNIQLPSLASQKGSYYAGILMFAMFIVLLVCGMKIGPAYLDNNIIRNSVESLASTGELRSMTQTELRSALMRNLLTNNIRDFDAKNVTVTREGDQEFVDINYEKRIHLFLNIDAVVAFSERLPKS
jgi:hypothetical protein